MEAQCSSVTAEPFVAIDDLDDMDVEFDIDIALQSESSESDDLGYDLDINSSVDYDSDSDELSEGLGPGESLDSLRAVLGPEPFQLSTSCPTDERAMPTPEQPSARNPVSDTSAEDDDAPLYDGAKLSVFDNCLLLLQFTLRFQLSSVAFEALLTLLSAHLPEGNLAARSTYKMRKFCARVFPDIKSLTKHYCKRCHVSLQSNEQCTYCGSKDTGRFVIGDLASQLKGRFRDTEFVKGLQSRPSPSTTTVKDIYDGTEYAQYCRPGGFLCKRSNPWNLSFSLNTDGVSLFKSSSTDIWPVFLLINELPPHLRFSKKHILLAGLWYSDDKPSMLTYLQPIIDQLNHLFNQGIEATTDTGLNLTCRAMLLLCSVDLPARALVMNMKQFNGAYACSTCIDSGEQGSCATHRIWPFKEQCIIRTKDNTLRSALKAVEQGKAVMGYKGAPVLAGHKPFDLVKGVVTDYLHCVLLGVVKTLTNLWLDTAHRAEEYYIGNQTTYLNQQLSSIRVPDVIKRPPRCLKERKHWKGTEWQYWMLFYSLPLLDGILPSTHFLHYCALVYGIAVLLGENISQQDLDRAQLLLLEFCRYAGALYGFPGQTMNVHMLKHLVYHVRNWGPLWSYSCFTFESVNGDIRKLFHGTRDMSEKMLLSFSIVQSLPCAKKNLSPFAQYVDAKVTGESKRCGQKTYQYSTVMFRIGKSKCAQLDIRTSTLLNSACGFAAQNIRQFWRLQLSGILYYSQQYARSHSRNSYTITFGSGQCGIIQYFLEVKNRNDVFVFAIVDVQRIISYHNLPHFFESQPTGIVHVLPAQQITSKCVAVDLEDGRCYIGLFPCQQLFYIS